MPAGAWEFDAEVAACFDDMLGRSIPGYDDMRRLTAWLTGRYCPNGGRVLDVGCSRGRSIQVAEEFCPADATFVGVDTSPAMVEAASAELAGLVGSGRAVLIHGDVARLAFASESFDVVSCVLTLQFIPLEVRAQAVRNLTRLLKPGGKLLVVEKLLGESADIDDDFTARYYAHKASQGYSAEAIAAKRASLSGVLVPLSESTLRGWLLRDFATVDCYWRWCNFAGFVASR